MKDYLDIDETGQTTFKISKTPKINHLINEKRFDDALKEINQILISDGSDVYLNLKGIVLNNLSKYDEAIECFDKALKLNQSDEYQLNKANSYYNWAKITFFPEGDYDKALYLIKKGLETIPKSEDSSEFYFLKAEILEGQNELVEAQKAYLTAYKEFDRLEELESQIHYLENTTDVLVNIVGNDFYNFTPESGMIVDLIKDLENEHDPDAIAVMKNNEIVGYVANSDYTLISEVNSASDIKNKLNENQKAEILFIYLGEYVIARLIV